MAVISGGTTLIDNGTLDSGVAKGNLNLISSQTASSSSSISFTSISGYDSYIFKFINIHPQTNAQHVGFQASTDNGSSFNVNATTTLYRAYHSEDGAASGVLYRADYDLAQQSVIIPLSDGVATGNASDECVSGTIQIWNLNSTTYVKNFVGIFNEYHQVNYTIHGHIGGYFNTTTAINCIRFSMSSGNIDDGIIKLYGVGD